MPAVKLSTGITMHYEEYGQGEPLVLIYGTGGDHTAWLSTPKDLAREFRVIVPDNRGTGRTDKPVEQQWTMRTFADDTVALMEILDIDTAHIGGMSLGSAVTLEIAINYPQKVLSASLYNPWAKTDAFLKNLFELALTLARSNDSENMGRLMLWVLFSPHGQEKRKDLIAKWQDIYLNNPYPTPTEALCRHLEADINHDVLDRLHLVKCPTLVFAGEEDMNFMPRYPRILAEGIPNSEFKMLTGDGSSHLMYLERSDEFNSIAVDFLRRHSTVST